MGRLGLRKGEYMLATVHRAENTDNPARLRAVFDGLREIGASVQVVLPLHPRTRQVLQQEADRSVGGLLLTDPVGYLDMIMLEKHARLIATDSGGVQKEAFFYHVPCVTLRAETEWTELLQSGWNRLVTPASGSQVAAGIRAMLDAPRPTAHPAFYGDGNAALLISEHLSGPIGF